MPLFTHRFEEAQKCCTLGLTQLDVAKQGSTSAGGKGATEGKGPARPSQRSRPMLASQETLNELRWKAFVRRGRAHKGILMQLGGLSTSGSDRGEYESGIPKDGSGDSGDSDEDRQAEARGHMLLAARSDFAAALSIDPLDDIPRQEMASLTIHPLQRRPSGQDISKGLALASISQLDKERRRNSQETSMPAKPRRSESS